MRITPGLAVLLVWVPAAALGQVVPNNPEPEAEPSSQASESQAASPADSQDRGPVKPSADALRKELEDDPDADESIYIVQRRAYSKSGKFELTGSGFFSLNNKFVGYAGGALAAAYHIRENFAIELMSSVPFASYYSDLVIEVRQLDPPLEPQRVDLKQMTYFGALSAQFSALYGKFDFYGWLVDYDFYATGGFGLASTREVCTPPNQGTCGQAVAGIGYGQRTPEQAADQFKLAANIGGGARIFFADFIGLRLELRDIVYADRAADAQGTTTDIRNNLLMFTGLSFLL